MRVIILLIGIGVASFSWAAKHTELCAQDCIEDIKRQVLNSFDRDSRKFWAPVPGDIAATAKVLGDGPLPAITFFGTGISSITRISTGIYLVVLDQPLLNDNYTIQLTLARNAGDDDYSIFYDNQLLGSFQVSIFEQDNGTTAGVPIDSEFMLTVIAV